MYSNDSIRFSRAVMAVIGLLIIGTVRPAVGDVTVMYDAGTLNTTTALTGFMTTGAQMDGMLVTAFFAGGSSETVAWADTGPISGQALGGIPTLSWFLAESGDTFNNLWTLSNKTGLAIDRILIDAGTGNSVFDAILDPTLTPGSQRGRPFEVPSGGLGSGPSELDIVATYRDEVSLTGNDPLGDLYRYLDIEFTSAGGFANGRSLRYYTDTDNLLFAGDLNPIPEPGAALLGALGLGLVGWRRTKTS